MPDTSAESKGDSKVAETSTAGETNNTEEAQNSEEKVDDEAAQEGGENEFPPDELAAEEGEEMMEMDVERVEEKGEDTNGKVVCTELAATRIHRMISMSLIPQLHKVITQRVGKG